jgi:hypothetical protein
MYFLPYHNNKFNEICRYGISQVSASIGAVKSQQVGILDFDFLDYLDCSHLNFRFEPPDYFRKAGFYAFTLPKFIVRVLYLNFCNDKCKSIERV